MRIRKMKKKGFTIVELVIVIAVIAVLAAVLIPTFIALTNKAEKASDQSLVKNLNTALKTAEADQGKANDTYQDAIDDLKEYGYLLPNLVTKSNLKLLYNIEKNEFCLDDAKDEDVPDIDYWTIEDSIPSNPQYSIYPGPKFSQTSVEGLKVGFDAGETIKFTRISYDRSDATSGQNVVIRTNNYNTVLTVNAPSDVVKHYGKANKVDVIAVACLSYHEHGDVLGNITLNNGRVVVEEGAKANAVYVDATAEAITAGTVTVSADNSKEPKVPIILRDYVKEAADNKGGNNSIPNPATQNVIVLSDKVTGDETKTAIAAVIKPDKTIINYETFQEALNAMIPNSIVMLLGDIENSPILRLNKSVAGNYKIDLNGHTITFTTNISKANDDEMAFEIEGKGNYTICNGTLSCYSSEYGDVFETYCNTTLNNVTINFEDQSTIVGHKPNGDDIYGARWGAIYTGASEMVMNSCYINAISGPGIQNGEANAKLTINDSTIISADHSALYCSGASITEVNNSVVSGVRAIHACTSGATFIINSGTFTGTQYAIQLDNTDRSVDWQGEPNYAGCSFAFVYGGNFVGDIKLQDRPAGHGVAKLYVYGGTFDHDVSSYRVND